MLKNVIVKYRIVVAAFVLVAAASTIVFHNSIFNVIENSDLHQSTIAYLKNIEQEDTKTLIHLVEIKAIVDVFSSVDVGVELFVHADVGLGRALDSMSEMLDRAIVVTLASTSSASILMLCFSLMAKLTSWVVGVVLTSVAAYLVMLKSKNQKIKDITVTAVRYSTGVLVVFFLLIPYSINLAMHIDNQILAQERSERHKSLSYLNDEMTARHADIIRADNIHNISIHDLKSFKGEMLKRTEVVIRYFIYKNISIAFNLLVPLMMLAVMWLGLRQIVRKHFS